MRRISDETPEAAVRPASHLVLLISAFALILVIGLSLPFYLSVGQNPGQTTATLTAAVTSQGQTTQTATTTASSSATTADPAAAALESRRRELDTLSSRLIQQSASLQILESKQQAGQALRPQFTADLTAQLLKAGLTAAINAEEGTVNLGSGLTFRSGSTVLSAEGKAVLDKFLPVFLAVVFSEAWRDKVDRVCIDGHADDGGTYLSNLSISQGRSEAVMTYLMSKNPDKLSGLAGTESFLIISGRSSSNPILEGGNINKELSRRVEFRVIFKSSALYGG